MVPFTKGFKNLVTVAALAAVTIGGGYYASTQNYWGLADPAKQKEIASTPVVETQTVDPVAQQQTATANAAQQANPPAQPLQRQQSQPQSDPVVPTVPDVAINKLKGLKGL